MATARRLLIFGASVAAGYGFTQYLYAKPPTVTAPAVAAAPPPPPMRSLKLMSTSRDTHDSVRYHFACPDGLDLPVASCIVLSAKRRGAPAAEDPVERPYTPVSPSGTDVDVVVKHYPTGKMGGILKDLQPGDSVSFKGPFPKIPYADLSGKRVGMIAGGSGITPMLQILRHAAATPGDKTKFVLVYANKTPDDIMAKADVDAAAAASGGRVSVVYSNDSQAGYLTADKLKSMLPPPADDVKVLVCGPPGMMASVSGEKTPDYQQGEVAGFLKQLGYTSQHVFKF